MTAPVVVTASKAKAWWALLLPQIPAVVTFLLQIGGSLPEPYGTIFGALFSLLGVVTGAVVHQAPYVKTGTVLVDANSLPPAAGSGWPQP